MDFKHNRDMLNGMMEQYFSFVRGNPEAAFPVCMMPWQEAAKAGQLTVDALGEEALELTYGVKAGDAISLFTGNAPSSPTRAAFLATILTNWTTFFGWMQNYLAQQESGYNIVFQPGARLETGEQTEPDGWLAVGPGFYPDCGQPIGYGLTATEALADLHMKLGREN